MALFHPPFVLVYPADPLENAGAVWRRPPTLVKYHAFDVEDG
jgi:hypothetical protein